MFFDLPEDVRFLIWQQVRELSCAHKHALTSDTWPEESRLKTFYELSVLFLMGFITARLLL